MANWSDLKARAISAAVMLLIGGGAVLSGGVMLHLLIAIVSGAMIWELSRILAPDFVKEAAIMAAITVLSVLCVIFIPHLSTRFAFIMVPLIGTVLLRQKTPYFMLFSYAILFGSLQLNVLRQDFGLPAIIWFLLVIILSDLAGYFAGRKLGGPKFWPKLSPKKTWSGTVAGWGCAIVLGGIFALVSNAPFLLLVGLSVVLSFAGQMGDIAESALKRSADIKDSSNLIPGHGGVLDRFDAVIGGAVFLIVVSIFMPLTQVLP